MTDSLAPVGTGDTALTTTGTVIVVAMNGRPARDIQAELAKPFDAEHIKAKPQVVKGNRALASFYIDARVVQERLDEVLGIEGWTAHYVDLPGGSVRCELAVFLGNQWVTKCDVGSPSDQPDAGDRVKAAYSDALKRAAVHFGVGRHLYRMPTVWHDYDPAKKAWASPVMIPGAAKNTGTTDAPPPKPPPPPPPPPASPPPPPKPAEKPLPKTAYELDERLAAMQKAMIDRGLCQPGDLFRVVIEWGKHNRLPNLVEEWPVDAIAPIVAYVKKWYVEQEKAVNARAAEKPKTAATSPPLPAKFSNPPSDAGTADGEDIGAREALAIEADERDVLETGLYELADRIGKSGSELIRVHQGAIGVQSGATVPSSIGRLSVPQLRALTSILQALVRQQ